ncbi:SpoIIE family protein phosphatase [Thiohalobacter sp. IOR34]|uniref:ATP-binding SpoIIE family protein phosphatase n=1 Tax=Thiohalobacter sp. IOR34 TaxID=3057176 RepID=UPI0025AEF77D|nr:SpoIIE family protein phosphatase [Thiohalobacter sp. IOR34]WJW76429.1 SpoIIE family protein phosphatase [Thiohalobacter sp. IOR34]
MNIDHDRVKQAESSEFDRLRIEQLLSGSFASQLGAIAVGLILAITFSHDLPPVPILGWLLLVFAAVTWRYHLAHEYFHDRSEDISVAGLERRHALASFASGCVWGLAGVLFFNPQEPDHQIMLLVVLGGICAAAVPMLAVSPKSLAVFVVPTILPATAMLLGQDDVHSHSLGLISIVFVAMLFMAARNFYFTFTRSMRLQLANRRLLEEAEGRARALEAAQEQVLAEHEVALQLFEYVLPRKALEAPNINYHVSSHSLFNGDLLLVESRPDGTQHLMLGDFTGHGLVASLGALQVIDVFNSMTKKGFSIDEIAAEINRKLNEQLPPNLFCAACLAEIDHVRGHLKVWNGGLPSVYVLHGKDGTIRYKLPSEHPPLGILREDAFDRHLLAIDLEEGDHLFMATDGVIEQIDMQGEPFGEQRLEDVLNATRDIHDLTRAIKDALDEYCSGIGQTDDISFVAIKPSAEQVEQDKVPAVEAPARGDGGSWRLLLDLDAATLRGTNPVPLVNHIVRELNGQTGVGSDFEVILDELFRNALEHGLLKLDSELKKSPDGFMLYYEERQRRLEELSEGRILIELINTTREGSSRQLNLDIVDSGKGFDHEAFMRNIGRSLDVDNITTHGRGIALAQELCEDLRFDGPGNQVRARYLYKAEA